jgi:hypothetical protein
MNSASAMKKKNAENARTTPAAPNAPAPIPAFLADLLISVLASSTSPRISVETSAMALCTSVPTEGSAGAAGTTVVVVVRPTDAEWATGISCRKGCRSDVIVPETCHLRSGRVLASPPKVPRAASP